MDDKKRKSERIEYISPGGMEEMTIFDLSNTGACCYHDQPKEKGAFVIVKVNDLSIRAKVAYCAKREDGYRLGVQFWNLSFDKQKKLNYIVEAYSKGVPIRGEIVDDMGEEGE